MKMFWLWMLIHLSVFSSSIENLSAYMEGFKRTPSVEQVFKIAMSFYVTIKKTHNFI